jgi:hypothetical protein
MCVCFVKCRPHKVTFSSVVCYFSMSLADSGLQGSLMLNVSTTRRLMNQHSTVLCSTLPLYYLNVLMLMTSHQLSLSWTCASHSTMKVTPLRSLWWQISNIFKYFHSFNLFTLFTNPSHVKKIYWSAVHFVSQNFIFLSHISQLQSKATSCHLGLFIKTKIRAVWTKADCRKTCMRKSQVQDILYMTCEGLLQEMGIICGHWAKQNMPKMEVHTSNILVTTHSVRTPKTATWMMAHSL